MLVKVLDVFLLPNKYKLCEECNILMESFHKQCPLCKSKILSTDESDIIGYVEDIVNNVKRKKDYNDEIQVY